MYECVCTVSKTYFQLHNLNWANYLLAIALAGRADEVGAALGAGEEDGIARRGGEPEQFLVVVGERSQSLDPWRLKSAGGAAPPGGREPERAPQCERSLPQWRRSGPPGPHRQIAGPAAA